VTIKFGVKLKRIGAKHWNIALATPVIGVSTVVRLRISIRISVGLEVKGIENVGSYHQRQPNNLRNSGCC
jgi:hypothetical protein